MAIGPRLDLRQSQSLVMTPRLQQAIGLLALSNLDLAAFVAEAAADNPLVEIAGGDDAPAPFPQPAAAFSPSGRSSSNESFDGAETRMGEPTLAEHLHAQIGLAGGTGAQQFIARQLVDHLDEAGYLPVPLAEIAAGLDVAEQDAEAALQLVQSLDPTGVGARTLAECLALQAKEADRYDPCMQVLIANLNLLARGNFARLRRMCAVDEADFAGMVAELRGYDPKPGCRFGGGDEARAVVPDVLVDPSGRGWRVMLNPRTLPRLLVNREYYLEARDGCTGDDARGWLAQRLADADWLARALDQRQKTILRVAEEILRRQRGFFERGVRALVPLTLREVAKSLDLHESTISRVTSGKFLHCPRGTFDMKYFFSSGLAKDTQEAASAEAVKAAIRALVEREAPTKILSDDALVAILNRQGYALARRTVAKYREAIGIGSSVERRRQKRLSGAC